jgi:hypothetical protein
VEIIGAGENGAPSGLFSGQTEKAEAIAVARLGVLLYDENGEHWQI